MEMSTMKEKMMCDASLRYPLCHVLLLNLCDDDFEQLCDHEAMMHLNYYFSVFLIISSKKLYAYVFFFVFFINYMMQPAVHVCCILACLVKRVSSGAAK
jgi:hypothetical protein